MAKTHRWPLAEVRTPKADDQSVDCGMRYGRFVRWRRVYKQTFPCVKPACFQQVPGTDYFCALEEGHEGEHAK